MNYYTVLLLAGLLLGTPAATGAQQLPEGSIDWQADGDGMPAVDAAAAAADGAAPVADTPAPATLLVPRDTPVHLMVVSEVTTKTHAEGHKFKLRVDQPVLVDGRELIPVGATAWGEVTSAKSSGNIGKSGKLSARLLTIDLNGTSIPIDGETSAKGKSGTAETLMGFASLGVLALFTKGNNAKIKAGEMMTAFVSEDTQIPAGS